MRRFSLAAVTCLQGAVACGTIWGFEDPHLDNSISDGKGDAGYSGPVVETPPVAGDPSRTCVPIPPKDWLGPLIFSEVTAAPLPPAPACATGYQNGVEYFTELVAPDAACECTCDPENGASCAATVQWFKEAACANKCSGQAEGPVPLAVGCNAAPGCDGAKFTSTYKPGACAPKRGQVTKPDTTWKTRSYVCAPSAPPTGAGCEADRIATPTTSLPFTPNTYCIAKTGQEQCPGTYPRQRLYYAGVNDARGCDCTCGDLGGGGCETLNVTDDAVCATKLVEVKSDNSCVGTKKYSSFNATPKPGTCRAEQHPTGNAAPSTPWTICCTR